MKITTRGSEKRQRIDIEITPEGFWSSMSVVKRTDLMGDNWEDTEISYGSGGTDGTLNSVDCALTHAIAIKKAVKIARNLDKLYNGKTAAIN